MIVFQRGNDAKKRVEVDESEASRIAILDRSPHWRRIGAPAPSPPVAETPDPSPGGETEFAVKDLSTPARRALEAAGLWSREAIMEATDDELLDIDGVGDASLAILRREVV
ncbi:MAG: hypothetical protein ACO1SV_12290 [Fimbriimonas sp.]